MQAQVLESTTSEISISLSEADISTLYAIQRELLKSPSVDFAGVIVKHPLTNECWLRVNASKAKPIQELEKATVAAIKIIDEIKSAVDSKLGSK